MIQTDLTAKKDKLGNWYPHMGKSAINIVSEILHSQNNEFYGIYGMKFAKLWFFYHLNYRDM